MDTYIVSGRMRSGTSMMMQSCIKGGMRAEYKENIRARRKSPTSECPHPDKASKFEPYTPMDEDYHPNPSGFFEAGLPNYKEDDVESLVVKVLAGRLTKIPVVESLTYNIVFMVRPNDEVIMSAQRSFGMRNFEDKILQMDEARAIIDARDDFNAIYINYHDVVSDPIKEITKLKDAGWPIDIDKAATVPTPELYRNKAT